MRAVQDFTAMFKDMTSLTELKIPFNTESAVSFVSMFENCGKLTSLDISKFTTQNVKNYTDILKGAKSDMIITMKPSVCEDLYAYIKETYKEMTIIEAK